MLPNIGIPEMLLILVLALIVFGPKRLPEVGKSLGKTIKEFRRATSSAIVEINQATDVGSNPDKDAPEQKKA